MRKYEVMVRVPVQADDEDHAIEQALEMIADGQFTPYVVTPGPFRVDHDNSDEEYMYVDVSGRGTVIIKNESEGIVVDIYPLHVAEAPVASTWAHDSDLIQEEE